MPDGPTAERGHLPASIFERNRVLRCRNHPKTSENLIFCELRNFNSETSSLVTLPSSGESNELRYATTAPKHVAGTKRLPVSGLYDTNQCLCSVRYQICAREAV